MVVFLELVLGGGEGVDAGAVVVVAAAAVQKAERQVCGLPMHKHVNYDNNVIKVRNAARQVRGSPQTAPTGRLYSS